MLRNMGEIYTLDVHRSQTEDFAPLLLAEFSSNDTVHSRPNWLSGLVNQYARIIIESDDTSILPLQLLLRPDDNRVSDITLSNFLCGRGAAVTGIRET